jgi:hypothetical protein
MKTYIILLAFLLSACCNDKNIRPVETVEVKVPVVVPCISSDIIVKEPVIYIDQITLNDIGNPGRVVNLYKATVVELYGVYIQQKGLIDGCRNLPPITSLPK